MGISVMTDPVRVADALDARLADDPVRSTVLGTIRLTLADGQCWCAKAAAGGLAVRSDPSYPLQLHGAWSAHDIDALAAELTRMDHLAGIDGPAPLVTSLVERLARPVVRSVGMRLFRLDDLTEPSGVAGLARRARDDDEALVRRWFTEFAREAHAPAGNVERSVALTLRTGGCWLWLDPAGSPVSMAVRRPVVAGSARIGPVYTPPQHRGRGYGSAVTAAATKDVLSDDAIPVLFTDLSNPVSNAIYQRLGYRPVEDRQRKDF